MVISSKTAAYASSTPGHTSGSISLYQSAEAILFSVTPCSPELLDGPISLAAARDDHALHR